MKEDITLRGIIVPADWNRDGEIVDLALLTDDEGEFLVERGGVIWDKLLDYIREEIDVTSFQLSSKYTKQAVAKQTIAIKSFNKVENRKASIVPLP